MSNEPQIVAWNTCRIFSRCGLEFMEFELKEEILNVVYVLKWEGEWMSEWIGEEVG